MFLMTAPAHQQAMRNIAAKISAMPVPVAAPKEPEPDRGLRVGLHYATARSKSGEARCHYLLKYPSGGRMRKKANGRNKQVINAFVIDGMTQDEVANEVVVQAIGKIIEANLGTVKIYVEQENLRARLTEALPLFPQLRLLDVDDFEGQILSQYAKARVTDRAAHQEKEYLLKFERAKALKMTGLHHERKIYVDASFGLESERIGYGYIIKDEIKGRNGVTTWRITYGADTSLINPKNGSTGAELQAIRNTLSSTGAVDKDIRDGYRTVTICSDSLWGIRILKAKRLGTAPNLDQEVLPHWDSMAEGVIRNVKNVRRVNFEWVKGHSDDPLNHAADRLAVASRRAFETGASNHERLTAKENIIREMVCTLEASGLQVVINEHNASKRTNKEAAL